MARITGRVTACFTLSIQNVSEISEIGRQEIGYLEVHEGIRDWTVTSLWIHSEHRNRGWGTLLMKCMHYYVQQWEIAWGRRYKQWIRWTDASDRCFHDQNVYLRLGAVYVKKKDPDMKWSIHEMVHEPVDSIRVGDISDRSARIVIQTHVQTRV